MVTDEQISSNNKFLSVEESPVGRLKENLAFWKTISTSNYILSIITEGFRIPFTELPSAIRLDNNLSAINYSSFVSAEIERLLDRKCISQVFSGELVINPLTVAIQKNGKKRLILDCRYINKNIAQFKFRFENYIVAHKMLLENCKFFSFDLKSAYHHIEIFDEHRKYLAFRWENKNYVFNV